MELLKTDGVSKVFGGLKAVSNFDIEINEGELIGLIGPNGAGKTTAFNLLTGVYQPTTGTIDFAGKSFVVLTPIASAAISFSRTAIQERPYLELTKFLMKNNVNNIIKNTHGKVVLCGIPLKPAAPPTYSIFMITIRMISPKPNVAIAK